MSFKNLPLTAYIRFALVFILSLSAFAQDPADEVRSIKPREYAKRLQQQIAQKRPASKKAKKKLLSKYVPTAGNDVPVAEGVNVGVTLWRLRPAQKTDPKDIQEQTRIVIRRKGQAEEKTVMMVPTRAESETAFADGDLFKLTLEPPFECYINIINREQYEDGSYSEPYLIFPAKIDAGKNDKGFPGRLLFLPSENDNDKFEVTRLNRDGKKKSAEVFTIILSLQPLKELAPLEKSDEPRRIDAELFERWQREWGGRVWRFESQGSARARITEAEKGAGAKVGAKLSDEDPPPQTVYHVASKSTDILLFDISLRIGK
jgi:hypothetical protein